jgi:hypothetical protein
LLELPAVIALPSGTSNAAPAESSSPPQTAEVDPDRLRLDSPADETTPDPDFAISSTFDVPAFLRRQEG